MTKVMRFLWLLVTQFIAHRFQGRFVTIAFANGEPVNLVNRYTLCLAKRDQSATRLTPNYFFIICIIKNSPKMAYIMNTLYME